eukprot:g3073.t1
MASPLSPVFFRFGWLDLTDDGEFSVQAWRVALLQVALTWLSPWQSLTLQARQLFSQASQRWWQLPQQRSVDPSLSFMQDPNDAKASITRSQESELWHDEGSELPPAFAFAKDIFLADAPCARTDSASSVHCLGKVMEGVGKEMAEFQLGARLTRHLVDHLGGPLDHDGYPEMVEDGGGIAKHFLLVGGFGAPGAPSRPVSAISSGVCLIA